MSRVRRNREKERARADAIAAAAGDPEALARVRVRESHARDTARARVVREYARTTTKQGETGCSPVTCRPSRDELEGLVPRRSGVGNDGKIIYDSPERARACAAQLQALGFPSQRAYRCDRGRNGGHWHLATRDPAVRAERRRFAAWMADDGAYVDVPAPRAPEPDTREDDLLTAWIVDRQGVTVDEARAQLAAIAAELANPQLPRHVALDQRGPAPRPAWWADTWPIGAPA